MTREVHKKRVCKVIKFSTIIGDNGEFLGGGILTESSHIEREMWTEIYNQPRHPDPESVDSPGRECLQVHLGSSKEALKELGYFLIGLSMMETNHNDFSWGFDITTRDYQPMLRLIFHTPSNGDIQRSRFPEIHTVAKKIIE